MSSATCRRSPSSEGAEPRPEHKSVQLCRLRSRSPLQNQTGVRRATRQRCPWSSRGHGIYQAGPSPDSTPVPCAGGPFCTPSPGQPEPHVLALSPAWFLQVTGSQMGHARWKQTLQVRRRARTEVLWALEQQLSLICSCPPFTDGNTEARDATTGCC